MKMKLLIDYIELVDPKFMGMILTIIFILFIVHYVGLWFTTHVIYCKIGLRFAIWN